MVERRGDPTDRRCWRLHLTDAARPLMSEIDTQLTDLASITLAGLDEDKIKRLQAALAGMREAIASELKRTPTPPPPPEDEAVKDAGEAA